MKECSTFSNGMLFRIALLVFFRSNECDSVVDHRFTMNSHRQEHLIQQGRAPQDLMHEVVFAVRQKNTENLEAELLERSTPESPKYQQWMTFDEVGNLTSNPVGAGMIKDWLVLNNATVTWESLHNDYIKATAPVQTWEYLFSTEFHQWEDTGRTQYTSSRAPNLFSEKQQAEHQSTLLVLAKEYTIPKNIREHLETAFNTVQPPPLLSPRYHIKDQVDMKRKLRAEPSKMGLSELSYTFPGVTPPFLNAFYKIQSNKGNKSMSQAVFETSGEKFSPGDLKNFQISNNIPRQAAVDRKGISSTETCLSAAFPDSSNPSCYEGNLDLQFLMGIAQRTTTIYWYEATGNPFLSWITSMANTPRPPLSSSISWGTIEQQVDIGTMNAFNNEALKLGLMGSTILVSSGDYGATNVQGASSTCMCGFNSASTQSKWTGGSTWKGSGYFPSFPATSPYVTSVGGTQGPDIGLTQEVACQSQSPYRGVITTGGGFSTYYPAPIWQKAAITKYFAGLDSTNSPVSGYNIMGRGYPDISLLAVDYQIMVGGDFLSVFGTSASAPVLAGFVTLVNSARAKKGKPPIGFLNKMLYDIGAKNITHYNDVTEGHNKCCAAQGNKDPICCNTGFTSTPGWDPVTGWGSIDYTVFASMFSVAAPYNGTDPSSFYKPNAKGIELTMIDIIFVFFAGAVFFIVVGTTGYFCCCRRKNISPIPDNIVYNQNYPTAQDLATANGAYAAAVAHSHSIDFSNSADAYYIDPAHTLSPSAPVRTQAVEVGVARASSIGSDLGPEGEPDLIPDSDLQRAEENELARQKDIMELLEMGFTFDIAENALENCNWDKARAIEHLTSSAR